METREPKKGRGVPKETREQNSIAALQSALAARFPDQAWGGLRDELERRGFFEAGMQQQVRLMAETALALLDASRDPGDLIRALAASPAEKVRGVAPVAVRLAYADDLDRQLEGLYFTGALEGTWPREQSNGALHDLIIRHGVEAVLARVGGWVADPNPAIRRLVAEAFRPHGVMTAHIDELKRDPTPLKAILEPLLDDPSDYVRKAVANNLNDLSKSNPDVVLEWAQAWNMPDASPERQWILARALRTLVEAGNPAALHILGYAPTSSLNVVWKDGTPQTVQINQLLPFELEIANPSDADARVIALLLLDEPGKGKSRRRSTYQLWKGIIQAGGSRRVSKRVHFVDMTTQLKEPGTYQMILTINGEPWEERTMTFWR